MNGGWIVFAVAVVMHVIYCATPHDVFVKDMLGDMKIHIDWVVLEVQCMPWLSETWDAKPRRAIGPNLRQLDSLSLGYAWCCMLPPLEFGVPKALGRPVVKAKRPANCN